MKVRCHLCGYQGMVPASPDLKRGPGGCDEDRHNYSGPLPGL